MVFRIDSTIRRRFTVAVVFLTWLLLVRGAVEVYDFAWPASSGAQPLRNAGSQAPGVALTFNITWGDRAPAALLKILAEHDVTATFFVSGPWARQHEELLQSIVEAGHEVGSFGQRQLDLTDFSPADLQAELQTSVAALADSGAGRPVFFRPPAGAYNDELLQTAGELGLMTVLWDVDAQDWLQPGPEHIVETVTHQAQPGSIILLHANDSNGQTLSALPGIITSLRQANLEPLPLGKLLAGPEMADPAQTGGQPHPATPTGSDE